MYTYVYLWAYLSQVSVLRFIVAAMHHKGENLAFIAAICKAFVVVVVVENA